MAHIWRKRKGLMHFSEEEVRLMFNMSKEPNMTVQKINEALPRFSEKQIKIKLRRMHLTVTGDNVSC